MVIELVRKIRDKGLPVIIISHNIPQVYEIADRIHIQRLGKRAALIDPQDYKMEEVVAIMTGAMQAKFLTHDGSLETRQECHLNP